MCFFKVKHSIGHISGMVGPIDEKRKGGASVGYWVNYVTLTFDLTHDLDSYKKFNSGFQFQFQFKCFQYFIVNWVIFSPPGFLDWSGEPLQQGYGICPLRSKGEQLRYIPACKEICLWPPAKHCQAGSIEDMVPGFRSYLHCTDDSNAIKPWCMLRGMGGMGILWREEIPRYVQPVKDYGNERVIAVTLRHNDAQLCVINVYMTSGNNKSTKENALIP